MTSIPQRTAAQNAVGSINGQLTVSEMGAAVYSVTFDVPNGGRMAPQVGLAYNSQFAGYGLAGYGIDVTGLSVITSGGRDMFHNGKVRGTNYEGDGNLYLDGKRLVLQSGDDGMDGAVYAPEGDPHTKVTQHGGYGANSVPTFEVSTKDGGRIVYGGDAGSRFEFSKNGTLRCAAWYVSHAENKYGEGMAYAYTKDNLCIRPQSITYGREGASCSVEFAYRQMSLGNERRFRIAGQQGVNDKVLDYVTTKMNGSVYRRYDFQYDEAASNHFSRLTTITERNGAGDSLNPTVLTWKSDTVTAEITHETVTFETENPYPKNFAEVGESQYFSADMNGDGIGDGIRICQTITSGCLYTCVYISTGYLDQNGKTKFAAPVRYDLPGHFAIKHVSSILGAVSVMDHDGDGLNDIVMPYLVGGTMVQLCFVYGASVRNHTTGYSSLNVSLSREGEMPLFAYLDMNGDGRDDIIAVEKSGNDGRYEVISLRYDEAYGPSAVPGTVLDNAFRASLRLQSAPKRLFTGDYNGDGLADLFVKCENGYTVFFNNGYTEGQGLEGVFTDGASAAGTMPRNYWRMEQGDFDGDGLVDFFCHNDTTGKYAIACNNGDGTFCMKQLEENWGVYEQKETKDDDDRFTVMVTDFDGDGRSDVLLSKAMYKPHHYVSQTGQSVYTYDRTLVRWLRSTGNGFEQWGAFEFNGEGKSEEGIFFAGDFDGDGKAEIANYGIQMNADYAGSVKSAVHLYKFRSRDASVGRVVAVHDGFGNGTSVEYSYFSGLPRTGAGKYPVHSYSLPVPVVSSVKSDGQHIMYGYENLLLHIGGGGLLGFSKLWKDDCISNTTEATEITAWDEKSLKPSKITRNAYNGRAGFDNWQYETYKSADTGNGNRMSYMSEKTIRESDGNTVTCKYTLDTSVWEVTDMKETYDGNNSMYRESRMPEYIRLGNQLLPTVIVSDQMHPDDWKPYSNVKKYSYNAAGDPVMEISHSGTSLADTVRYTYDRWGNVLSETFHGNDATTGRRYYKYDSTGRFLIREYTSPASYIKTYTYDQWGHLLTETDATNASHPLTTTHQYDAWGRRTHTTYPDGTESTYETNWTGNNGGWYTMESHTAAPWKKTTYDRQGREVKVETVGAKDISISKTTEYNDKGQVSKVTDTYGSRTTTETYAYDARGRVISDQHSSGAGVTYEYGRNTVTTTDAAGRSVTKTYDAWGSVKTVTDNEGNIVEYQYGSHGNPVNVTTGDATVTMEYDELGRRTKLIDPDAGTITTTYGRNGQVISETDGRGVKTTYTYDALGRVTQRKREDTTNKWVDPSITSYTYGTSGNSKGRIVKKDCDGKAVSYEYDMYGRVTRESRGMAYNHDYTYDELRKTYTYDSYGRLATVTYPASHSSKGITIGYRYDSNGNVTKVLFDNRLDNCLSRNYSDDGLRREIRSDYLGKTVIDYDNDGYPVSKSYEYINSKNNRGISDALSFSWDKTTGNLLGKTINGKTETYSYDNLDRLTGVSCNGVETMTMSFADNGNIISKTGIGEYTYYDGDRPHAVREVENVDGIIDNREVSTQYALNGKVTSIWNKDYTAYSWYEYGPDDEKWSSWGWTPDDMGLEWDVDRVYWGDYERLTKDYHIREYYFLDNDVFLIRENSYADSDGPYSWNENFYQMERDNIGNIVAIYDLFHRKVFEAEYDAWGKQTVIKDDICFNHGFTGHEMLPQFGLIHMDGRVYDPAIGRFLSPDNYVQLPENSQSLNRYSYCINNPLKYTDPTGEVFGIDDFIAMLSGGTINLLCNIKELVNPFHAIALFAVGAAAGEATLYGGPMAGAAVAGVGNSIVNQWFNGGEVNLAQVFGDTFISMGASYIGGALSSYISPVTDKLFSGISNDIVRKAVSQAACSSVVGAGLGGAFSLADSKTSFWDGAFKGLCIGAVSGAISGVVKGIRDKGGQPSTSKSSVQKNLEGYDEKPYSKSRPSYGKGQVEEVWENAKGPDGVVRDPHTDEIITWDKTKPRSGQWDMGHTEKNKYSIFHEKYMKGIMIKEDFLKWYRNPLHYRPELPKINRSHRFE